MIQPEVVELFESIVKGDEAVVQLLVGIIEAYNQDLITSDEVIEQLSTLTGNLLNGIATTRTIIGQLRGG